MTSCRICNQPTEVFLDLGDMPIANGFLNPDQLDQESRTPLQVAFCPACHMVQLVHLVEPAKIFHENYAYYSSTSTRMASHFETMATAVMERWLERDDPFVVEIGSNDGIMLQHFAHAGLRHLGIEPATNVADVARAKGIQTISRFFNRETATAVRAEHGAADTILGANVMTHIADLHSVLDGVDVLLADDGVLVFEVPYLGDIIEKTAYDQIYDEHAYFFSLDSVSRLLQPHGFELVSAEPVNVHGGSMRYTAARIGKHTPDEHLNAALAHESRLGLDQVDTFHRFAEAVATSRRDLIAALKELQAQGKRVMGYGGTAKSTTVLNYCGIGPELIETISDTTPIKQGKLSPGMHIPIVSYETFTANPPDVAVLFAWNHKEEILAKEQRFVEAGGRFLVYVPAVKSIAPIETTH